MMTLQILKPMDFTKAQYFRYLRNKTFLFQIKNLINCASRATYGKKLFCSRGNLYIDQYQFLLGEKIYAQNKPIENKAKSIKPKLLKALNLNQF